MLTPLQFDYASWGFVGDMGGNLNALTPAVMASWPTPNYVNPPQRTWFAAYAAVLQAVSTCLIILRFWMRSTNRAGSFGLDDWMLIPAYLGGVAFTTTAVMSNEVYHSDRHVWDVPPPDYRQIILLGWIAEVAYLVSTNCTKISVLLFYRRLVHGSYARGWKYAVISAIVFTIATGLALILMLIFNCTPTYAYWEQYSLAWLTGSEKHAFTCVDTRVINPLSGVISVLGDFYAVLLPYLMTRNIDAPRRQRLALYAVFSVGFLVVGAGIARTYYLDQLGKSTDLTWTIFDVLVFANLETQLAIICACAPSLRALFRQYFHQPLSRAVHSVMNSSGTHSAIRSSKRNSSPLNNWGAPISHAEVGTYRQYDHGNAKAMYELEELEETASERGLQSSVDNDHRHAVRTLDEYDTTNREVIGRAMHWARDYNRASSSGEEKRAQEWPSRDR